jgi:hypothetical protein
MKEFLAAFMAEEETRRQRAEKALGQALAQPKRADGTRGRAPEVMQALERGDALGAEQGSPADLSLKMNRQLLDKARAPQDRIGEEQRRALARDGFAFGPRGALLFDPASPQGEGQERSSNPLNLTPGRGLREGGAQPGILSGLAKDAGARFTPNSRERLARKTAFRQGLSQTDEAEFAATGKLLDEGMTALRGRRAASNDGLERKGLAIMEEDLGEMETDFAREKQIRETSVPSRSSSPDFDATRNEAPAQADARERESNLQPFNDATRRNLEDVERAQADLERQRQRQRAILEQSAEERDDPAMRPQRQQAVAKDIEEAQRNLGKARVMARDDILKQFETGDTSVKEAQAQARTAFGAEDPIHEQFNKGLVAAGARTLEQSSFGDPAKAGEAAGRLGELRQQAETRGELNDAAKGFYNKRSEDASDLPKLAKTLEEKNAALDTLAAPIAALEQKKFDGTLTAGERQELRELKDQQSDAAKEAATAQETLTEKSKTLIQLEVGHGLAALVEARNGREVLDQVFQVGEAIKEGSLIGGVATGALEGAKAFPNVPRMVTRAAGGFAKGAVFGGLTDGTVAGLQQMLADGSLDDLPRLLREDPQKAIDVVGNLEDLELLGQILSVSPDLVEIIINKK